MDYGGGVSVVDRAFECFEASARDGVFDAGMHFLEATFPESNTRRKR